MQTGHSLVHPPGGHLQGHQQPAALLLASLRDLLPPADPQGPLPGHPDSAEAGQSGGVRVLPRRVHRQARNGGAEEERGPSRQEPVLLVDFAQLEHGCRFQEECDVRNRSARFGGVTRDGAQVRLRLRQDQGGQRVRRRGRSAFQPSVLVQSPRSQGDRREERVPDQTEVRKLGRNHRKGEKRRRKRIERKGENPVQFRETVEGARRANKVSRLGLISPFYRIVKWL